MRLTGVDLGPGGRREEQGVRVRLRVRLWWIRVCPWLGVRGRRCTCAGGANGKDTVSRRACAWPKRGGWCCTYPYPTGGASTGNSDGGSAERAWHDALNERGTTRSASAFTCASAGAASAPAPAAAAPGTARATRRATAGGAARGQGVRGVGRRWRRVGVRPARGRRKGGVCGRGRGLMCGKWRGRGYSDARAGENVGENSDGGGASAARAPG
jgi:hypothetical protein